MRERLWKNKLFTFVQLLPVGKGGIIAPLIKRGKTRRRKRKGKKKKRPITAAATGHRNNKSLLEPLGRTYGRPNTTGPIGGRARKSQSHGHLHANSFSKEELELKLKEVEKRYEKWQDASNTTPLQGETLVEIQNNNENDLNTVEVVSDTTIDNSVSVPEKSKTPTEIVLSMNRVKRVPMIQKHLVKLLNHHLNLVQMIKNQRIMLLFRRIKRVVKRLQLEYPMKLLKQICKVHR